MSFTGKFEVYKRDNYDEFARNTKATPEQIEAGRNAKVSMEVTQNGDTYTVKRIFPKQTTTNTFTLGVPSDLTFLEGKTKKATVKLENGKMVMTGENFSQVSEIVGAELKETLTFEGKSMTRWSKRV